MIYKQDESKTRILEAAKFCFANFGYNGTSVRKICEMADANLALVSYYFGSKEKLYYKVIDYLYLDTSQKLGQRQSIDQPKEALEQFIDTFVHMRVQDKQFHMLLRHELSSGSARKEAIGKIISPYFDQLKKILATGKEKGIFHFESLELTSQFITSVLVYPAYDSFLIDSQSAVNTELKDEIKLTTDFILSGLNGH